MEDLELDCENSLGDSFTVSERGEEELFMSISESETDAGVVLSKEKAMQLRDWLNKFLGEA